MTKYTISVDLAETDVSVEEDETFTVTLDWQQGEELTGVGLANAEATATIYDDDVLTALLTGPVVVPAGLPARYPVRLTGGTSTANVVVSYEVTGSATVDVDYTQPDGKLTIGLGQTADTITIETRAVADRDAGETLVVTLTDATTAKGSARVGTPREVTTTTTAQDTVVVSIRATDGTVTEGENKVFTVSLSGGASSDDVVVQYTVGGDVTEDDYGSLSGTVTIGSDGPERVATLTLSTKDDTLEEGDETLTVTLSLGDQTEDVEIGTPSASATITDNDTLTVTVSNNDMPHVLEGLDATFALMVAAAVSSTADVVVDYTVGGDVTSADYDGPRSRTHTIAAGSSTAIITIAT